jgi:hypothetical protein
MALNPNRSIREIFEQEIFSNQSSDLKSKSYLNLS